MVPKTSPARTTAKLVVLISGNGRNLQAILDAVAADALPAEVVRVISNRGAARGLEKARRAGVPTRVLRPRDYPDRPAYDAALADAIAAESPDIVALAGFMRILDAAFVQRFAGKLVNIHPSLLPRHRGLDTHGRALAAGDERHGASVHYVTEDLDAGPCLIQGSLRVAEDDTPDSLAERVMTRVEQRIYPQALAWIAEGRAAWDNGRIRFDGRPLETPIHVDCDPD